MFRPLYFTIIVTSLFAPECKYPCTQCRHICKMFMRENIYHIPYNGGFISEYSKSMTSTKTNVFKIKPMIYISLTNSLPVSRGLMSIYTHCVTHYFKICSKLSNSNAAVSITINKITLYHCINFLIYTLLVSQCK